MKYKTDELDGDFLDSAVAQALGLAAIPGQPNGYFYWDSPTNGASSGFFNPSRSWDHGGPIIERERIDISAPEEWAEDERWYAGMYQGRDAMHSHMAHESRGYTPLIAAMRAFVSSKFGSEVDL